MATKFEPPTCPLKALTKGEEKKKKSIMTLSNGSSTRLGTDTVTMLSLISSGDTKEEITSGLLRTAVK